MELVELKKIIADSHEELKNEDFFDDLGHPVEVIEGLIHVLERIAKEGLKD